MPNTFSLIFTLAKILGMALALLGAGYLFLDSTILKRRKRTAIHLVIEGKVSRREIIKLLEKKGYKVVKWR